MWDPVAAAAAGPHSRAGIGPLRQSGATPGSCCYLGHVVGQPAAQQAVPDAAASGPRRPIVYSGLGSLGSDPVAAGGPAAAPAVAAAGAPLPMAVAAALGLGLVIVPPQVPGLVDHRTCFQVGAACWGSAVDAADATALRAVDSADRQLV